MSEYVRQAEILARMGKELAKIDDVDNDTKRAGAYIALDVEAADIAMLDKYALIAEKARRRIMR